MGFSFCLVLTGWFPKASPQAHVTACKLSSMDLIEIEIKTFCFTVFMRIVKTLSGSITLNVTTEKLPFSVHGGLRQTQDTDTLVGLRLLPPQHHPR